MCTFNEHRDHEIMQFSEAVVKYKDNIRQLMTRCKDKIDKFDSQIDSLNQCDDIIRTVEQKVISLINCNSTADVTGRDLHDLNRRKVSIVDWRLTGKIYKI